jgi:hypothetical protein
VAGFQPFGALARPLIVAPETRAVFVMLVQLVGG